MSRKVSARVVGRYRARLREVRFQALMGSQEELARRTGIPRSAISDIERGRRFLSAPYALLVKEALGVPLDSLYERVGDGVRRTATN